MSASSRVGFDRIIGHDTAKRMLGYSVKNNNPSQALIITGMKSIGKLTLAKEYAKALSCENRTSEHACGECAVCRAIEHNNYPDIMIYPPDKTNTTSIDSMRTMRDMSSFRPMRGKWKINIIEQADTLNEESANCILKLLEEPPRYVVNILLYRNEAAALSTVRSRCRVLRLFQVPVKVLAERLVEDFGADPEHAMFLAAYSQGCPGMAISLLNDHQFQSDRDVIARVAANIISSGTRTFLKLAENIRSGRGENGGFADESDEPDIQDSSDEKKEKPKAKDTVFSSLDTLLIWYRDLMVARIQGPEAALVNSDRRQEVLRQSSMYPNAESLLSILRQIMLTRRSILGNANPQIQTEALLARIASIAADR